MCVGWGQPVVLGMATGYRWDALRNFVLSLRHSGFAVRVVVCVCGVRVQLLVVD
jgi:D-alanyl-D-alanine carboxypeptidase